MYFNNNDQNRIEKYNYYYKANEEFQNFVRYNFK